MPTPLKSLRVVTRFIFLTAGLFGGPCLKAENPAERIPREVLDRHGYASIHGPLPNAKLPEGLTFPAGKLSLIADPQSADHISIATYIVNDSGQPVPALDYELTRVWKEARLGETWKRTDEVGFGCGTVDPPKDLAAGHFLIETATSSLVGEHEGEIRYCLHVPGGPPVVSQTFQGKFSLKGIDEGFANVSPIEEILLRDLDDGFTRASWAQGTLAKSPDEFLAALELIRNYSTCELLRNQLRNALTKAPPLQEAFREELLEILNRPWPDHTQENVLFDQCLRKLSSADDDSGPKSENATLINWRVLNLRLRNGAFENVNPERYTQLQQLAASGNPWGADQRSVKKLISLALLAVEKNSKYASFAGNLLTSDWLTKQQLPDDQVDRLFGLGSPIAKQTALLVQASRDREKAIRQFSAIFKDLPDHFGTVWYRLANHKRPLEDWELPLFIHLLRTKPLSAYSALSSRYNRHTSAALSLSLPDELLPLFREQLLKEATRPKVLGSILPEYDGDGRLIRHDPETYNPYALSDGLSLLGRWEDPADTELIRKFLQHPGASYSRQDKATETKFYTVRERACRILKERNEPVPAEIVLKENIPARHLEER